MELDWALCLQERRVGKHRVFSKMQPLSTMLLWTHAQASRAPCPGSPRWGWRPECCGLARAPTAVNNARAPVSTHRCRGCHGQAATRWQWLCNGSELQAHSTASILHQACRPQQQVTAHVRGRRQSLDKHRCRAGALCLLCARALHAALCGCVGHGGCLRVLLASAGEGLRLHARRQ